MKKFINRHKRNVVEALTIFPTSWTMFIALAGFLGVVEFFGPFFRYLITSWQSLTRGMWDYFIFSHFDIYVREADKDGLTFSLFFLIFGYSLIPTIIKIINSDGENRIRKVNWKLFPIAFVISSMLTMLVITHHFHLDGTEKFKALSFVFASVIFFIFYFIVGFFPIFISYILDRVIQHFSTKNRLKEIFSIIVFLSSAYVSLTLLSSSAIFEYFKATVYVTSVVIFLVVLIPLLMPIIQPEKLIKLAIISLIICGVAYTSYSIEFFKQRAIAEKDGYIKDISSSYAIYLKQRIDTNCASFFFSKKNSKGGESFFSLSAAFLGITLEDFVHNTCPCIAKEIIKREKIEIIEKLSIKSEFEKNLEEISSSDIFKSCRKT